MYRVGILGYANIAQKYIINTINNHKDFYLYAIACSRKNILEEISSKHKCLVFDNYEDLIKNNQIDIVYIPLPNSLHYKWIKQALENGKHVLCEKSLTCSYQECEELCRIASNKNLLLMESFQFRFHDQNIFVQNQLKDNAIGDIRAVFAEFGFPPLDPGNIRYRKELGGGSLLDAGAYTVKILNYLFPLYSKKVLSSFLKVQNGVDIYGSASVLINNSFVANLNFGFDNCYKCSYELWGNKGSIKVDRAYTAPPNYVSKVHLTKDNLSKTVEFNNCNHFINMFNHIANLIQTKNYLNELEQNIEQSFLLAKIREEAIYE